MRRATPGPRPAAAPRLADPDVDRVLRDHARLLSEIAARPAPHVVSGVTLADATATPVAHGLGRAPRWVGISCARSPTGAALTNGQVTETRSGSTGADPATHVVLTASGYGAAVVVDLAVL